MTILSLLGIVALSILLILLTMALPFALLRNLARGNLLREELAEQVSRLRLSKMLQYLRIEPARYLHERRIVDIRRHMQRCQACKSTETCDRTIETPGRENADIGFCPNAASLTHAP
jgi:hypothetical protein